MTPLSRCPYVFTTCCISSWNDLFFVFTRTPDLNRALALLLTTPARPLTIDSETILSINYKTINSVVTLQLNTCHLTYQYLSRLLLFKTKDCIARNEDTCFTTQTRCNCVFLRNLNRHVLVCLRKALFSLVFAEITSPPPLKYTHTARPPKSSQVMNWRRNEYELNTDGYFTTLL
jgi:hypothetical protein